MWNLEREFHELASLHREWWREIFAPLSAVDLSVEHPTVELSFAPSAVLERRLRTAWERRRPSILDALANDEELPRFYAAFARLLHDDEVSRGLAAQAADRDPREPLWLGSSIRVGPLPASLSVDPQRWPVVPGTPFDPLSLERPAVPAGAVELVLGVVPGPDGVYTTPDGPVTEPFRLPAGFVVVGWDVANPVLEAPADEEDPPSDAPVRVGGLLASREDAVAAAAHADRTFPGRAPFFAYALALPAHLVGPR